ncbi:MAG: TonB-dependent receptor [Saprospiraceae bacterium]|nr:TonB-dependent receptor [Saprospiraceae bacterium]
MRSARFFLLLLIQVPFWGGLIFGQDSTRVFPVVEVVDDRIVASPGQPIQFADSLEQLFLHTGSLQDQLQLRPANHIRSYGPGRLSTLSSRGSGAGQNTTTLYGLNLLNPLWGLVDYSQIPLFFFPSSGQVSGNQTARTGNGSAAGQSALGTGLQDIQRSGGEAQLEHGSFDTWKVGLGARLAIRKETRALVRMLHEQAENDYPYKDLFGTDKRLPHARYHQQGALVDVVSKIASTHQLGVTTWLLKGYREIPPTAAQNSSEATQEDALARVLLRWQWQSGQWVGGIRLAYLSDLLHYVDPASGGLDNLTRSNQEELQTWAAFSARGGHSFMGEAGYRLIQGRSDHYPDLSDESRRHILLRYSWSPLSTSWKLWVSHRTEKAADELAGSIPALGVEYGWKDLRLRTHISRHIRWAAWDDRFWVPGGNPDIQPEKGWAIEGGLQWNLPLKATTALLDIQGYYRRVNDWIQWTPQSSGFWSPENLFHVKSQGLEASLSWKINDWLQYNCRYAFTQSIRQDKDEQLVTHQQQLPYVPEHGIRQQLYAEVAGFTFRIRHHWTDAVSTLADGSASLPAFHLIHLDLARDILWGRQQYLLWIRGENMLDQEYTLVRNLPLPGRQLSIGIRWTME